jgi:hypothetical protein
MRTNSLHVRRSGQTGLTLGLRTVIVSVENSMIVTQCKVSLEAHYIIHDDDVYITNIGHVRSALYSSAARLSFWCTVSLGFGIMHTPHSTLQPQCAVAMEESMSAFCSTCEYSPSRRRARLRGPAASAYCGLAHPYSSLAAGRGWGQRAAAARGRPRYPPSVSSRRPSPGRASG